MLARNWGGTATQITALTKSSVRSRFAVGRQFSLSFNHQSPSNFQKEEPAVSVARALIGQELIRSENVELVAFIWLIMEGGREGIINQVFCHLRHLVCARSLVRRIR